IAGGRTRFSGSVAEARGVLPARLLISTSTPPERLAPLLPADAERTADGWSMILPPDGPTPLLKRLIAADIDVRDIGTERPTLHDAFVAMVGDPEAEDARAVEMRDAA
ncbi:MAG: ABC transporter ATP-binding protein, partial [Pacificimonas sp.]